MTAPAPYVVWLLAAVGAVAVGATILAAAAHLYDLAVRRINNRDRLTITVRDRRGTDRRGGDWT